MSGSSSSPSWSIGGDVAWVDRPGRVALLDLAHIDRPPVILEGSAAVIWQQVAAGGAEGTSERTVVEEVAQRFGAAPADVAFLVGEFIDELRSLDLLDLLDPREPG